MQTIEEPKHRRIRKSRTQNSQKWSRMFSDGIENRSSTTTSSTLALNGKVTIQGTASTFARKDKADKLAADVPDIKEVANTLLVGALRRSPLVRRTVVHSAGCKTGQGYRIRRS